MRSGVALNLGARYRTLRYEAAVRQDTGLVERESGTVYCPQGGVSGSVCGRAGHTVWCLAGGAGWPRLCRRAVSHGMARMFRAQGTEVWRGPGAALRGRIVTGLAVRQQCLQSAGGPGVLLALGAHPGVTHVMQEGEAAPAGAWHSAWTEGALPQSGCRETPSGRSMPADGQAPGQPCSALPRTGARAAWLNRATGRNGLASDMHGADCRLWAVEENRPVSVGTHNWSGAMTQHEAIAALSRQTGVPLAFDGRGLCRLRFDGRFVVDLEVTDDETAIYLYCRLGPLPGGERGRQLMERMMRAHCLGRESGSTVFGLDDDDAVLAFVRVELAGAAEDVLYTGLEAFLDVLAVWADELA